MVVGGSQGHTLGWITVTVPLSQGHVFPKLPQAGVASFSEAMALPGAKSMEMFVFPGGSDTTYAFAKVTVHRNLFRIPLP